MAKRGIFLTGFPGFIAGRLVERLLEVHGGKARFFFLVEARFADVARARCEALAAEHKGFGWELMEGDIRQPDLGMSTAAVKRVRANVQHVWHLAALYNLAAPLPLSYSVNVDGTLRVLDLCESMPKLERLLYVSTCYVAGARHGRVLESELDMGQDFKNHYESTKHWAEKHVRERADRVPSVILRPAIVVGDSRSGETAKGDGPYYVMQLLFRLPKLVPGLHFGKGDATVNLVPVDYLVDAMARLSVHPDAVGLSFQIADPEPLPAWRIMELLVEATGHGKVIGTVPGRLVRGLLRSRHAQVAMGIPRQSYTYFEHEVTFDTANTQKLLGSDGPQCPRLERYLPVLVAYAKEHPEIFGPVQPT